MFWGMIPLLLWLFSSAGAVENQVTPVQKVIQLLEDMVAKGTEEKQAEEVQFAAYTQFCQITSDAKKAAIKKATEMIESLEADIQKYEADADELARQIAELDVDITTWEGDTKSTQTVRDIELKEYDKTRADFTDSIDALATAKADIEAQQGKVGQASNTVPPPEAGAAGAFAQIENSKLVPAQAKRAVAAFIAMSSTKESDESAELSIVAPEATELLQSQHVMKNALARHDISAADKALDSSKVAFMQMVDAHSEFLPLGARKALNAFIERSHARAHFGLDQDPGIANAYVSQSEGVIDMLDKLNEKFIKKRDDLDAENLATEQAFQKLKLDLKNNLDFAYNSRDEKKVAKTQVLQHAADAKGDLSDTTTTREDDEKFLADLTATCEQKASAYEGRQKLRASELTAVKQAIEIMSGSAVKGHSEKHLPQLLQIQSQRATTLVQLRAQSQTPAQTQVASYLRSQGKKLHSRLLATLAERIVNDPFKKVKKMVKDLIVKLMEEAQAETEHKGWCDTELATNEKTRSKKTADVENLHAQIDELEASIAVLASDVAAVSEAIAELDAAMAKATAIRSEEKSKNTVTIADAKEGQAAVSDAIGVLEEFYASASEATAFTQTKVHAKQPEIFDDEPYKGMGGENGGVIGMMEVIQADFARLESETKNSESQAQKEFDEFMDDSKVDKAQKEKDHEHWSASKQNQEQALVETKDTLAGTQEELDAAVAYYDKLKPSCIAEEGSPSYEERVARRKEEIESLKEALRILQGEEVI